MASPDTPAAVITEFIFIDKVGDKVRVSRRDGRLSVGSKGEAEALGAGTTGILELNSQPGLDVARSTIFPCPSVLKQLPDLLSPFTCPLTVSVERIFTEQIDELINHTVVEIVAEIVVQVGNLLPD